MIARHLVEAGHEVADFGTSSTDPVDYPDFIRLAAERWPPAGASGGSCSAARGTVRR